jgi:hypothetical protein
MGLKPVRKGTSVSAAKNCTSVEVYTARKEGAGTNKVMGQLLIGANVATNRIRFTRESKGAAVIPIEQSVRVWEAPP